jgi:hypothetical protein
MSGSLWMIWLILGAPGKPVSRSGYVGPVIGKVAAAWSDIIVDVSGDAKRGTI